jgi:hypothetical protein
LLFDKWEGRAVYRKAVAISNQTRAAMEIKTTLNTKKEGN